MISNIPPLQKPTAVENTPEAQIDTQNPEARLAPQPYKTFRVRGIPGSCGSNEARKIIKATLRLENEGLGLQVCSIASNPYRQAQGKVATISFASVPSSLFNSAGKDEWRFPLQGSEFRRVPSKDGDDDAPHSGLELVFDTHFRGFTSLRSFQNPLDHKIEYVTTLQNHKALPDRRSCIAISGLGGHAFGSFKERGGYHMWLRDSLPHDLPGARILIYGYDTRLEGSQSFQNVTTLAGQFRNQIQAIRGVSPISSGICTN